MIDSALTWADVFPETKLEPILKYVAESWEELTSKFPHAHSYTIREDKLTDSLAQHLDDPGRRQRSGISGRFICEKWNLLRLPGGEIKRESRSDIVYIDGIPGAPQLVIEFKKLAGISKLHKLYCSEGMARFVNGIYSPEQKIGAMCGILRPSSSEPDAVIRFLRNVPKSMVKSLGWGASRHGLHMPSSLAPTVALCDSVHARGPTCKNADISLAHMFITAH
jgi:hypothetical protein